MAEKGALSTICASDYIPSRKHTKSILQERLAKEFKLRWNNSTRGTHLKTLLMHEHTTSPPNIHPFSVNNKTRSLLAKFHTGGQDPWRSVLGPSPCRFCLSAGLGNHDETILHFFECRSNPIKNQARLKLVRIPPTPLPLPTSSPPPPSGRSTRPTYARQRRPKTACTETAMVVLRRGFV